MHIFIEKYVVDLRAIFQTIMRIFDLLKFDFVNYEALESVI